MKLTDRLVADWRGWHRMWSVRLGALAGIALAFLVEAPETALGALNALPPETRAAISPFAGLALWGLVTVVRLWKQKPPAPPPSAGNGE